MYKSGEKIDYSNAAKQSQAADFACCFDELHNYVIASHALQLRRLQAARPRPETADRRRIQCQ